MLTNTNLKTLHDLIACLLPRDYVYFEEDLEAEDPPPRKRRGVPLPHSSGPNYTANASAAAAGVAGGAAAGDTRRKPVGGSVQRDNAVPSALPSIGHNGAFYPGGPLWISRTGLFTTMPAY